MQTPISFALDILLDCNTIEKAHKLARRYIKVLESCGTAPVMRNPPNAIQQAPSTQRLLEQHGIAPVAPQLIATPSRLPAEIDKETGRAIVNTGGGAKGPRKF